MTHDPMAQRDGEGLPAYIARLKGVRPSRLDEDGRLALALSLSLARKRLQREETGPYPLAPGRALAWCKQAIRALTAADRKRLVFWIEGGMPD